LTCDPTSPIFLRNDTIFIPAALVSYRGHALDEKTPLLRASDALSKEGVRLLGLLGYKCKSLSQMIGLEQELFFIPRAPYLKRLDLQMTGRTVMGRMPPRGQEMSDHYMAPISLASPVMACMQEIQEQCFKMGIPLRTRHREVAPNQYEFAPLYGTVTTQIDQNLVVMQIIEEVSVCYGLTALLQEKPFQGVNGSGKHNNWSISTDDGTNLLNVPQLAKKTNNPEIFPVLMAAIIQALDEYGDLMRLSIATPGNDFRLGACEAPPAIFTTYLGGSMTEFLEKYKAGDKAVYDPKGSFLDMGASALPPVEIPTEDRNRTSPFPYGGHRFEFRSVGSSQNVSLVNTVLATICAKSFKEFADRIEKGEKPRLIAEEALKKHWKVVFNGNGYDKDNQAMLTELGCWRIDSGVDAICKFTEPKNVALFEEMQVFKPEECQARQNLLLKHYIGTVEMEANCMIDMINQHIIPSCVASVGLKCVGNVGKLESAVEKLKKVLHEIHSESDIIAQANKSRVLRLETMLEIRELCDATEAIVPEKNWTIGTYKDLLFLDQHFTK
jgi:glutamine synthetase